MPNQTTIQAPISLNSAQEPHHTAHSHHHKPRTSLYSQSQDYIRDALGNVMGAAHTISDLCTPEDAYTQDTLCKLQFEGLRLSHQFNQMLVLQQIEAQTFNPNINDYDVMDCLEQAVFENTSVLTSMGKYISLDCDEELSWFFDRSLIVTTVNSLLHTMSSFCQKNIQAQAFIENEQLVIRVSSDGHFPQDVLTALNAYQKLGACGPRDPQLLSLYFAHICAEQHQYKDTRGTMSARNHERGNCISIRLP